MAAASAEGCEDFVELGAGDTLTGLGRHCVPRSRWLGGQGTGRDALDQAHGLLLSLGAVYRAAPTCTGRWSTAAGAGCRCRDTRCAGAG
ncbi:hypothetical protein ACFQVA_00560 [Actinomadura keratinilytica]